MIGTNQVAVSFDKQLIAIRTMRIFQITNETREIAGIDESEARAFCNGGGTPQHGGRRVLRIGHLVVGMERRHVPWNIRRDACDEFGQTRQFIL